MTTFANLIGSGVIGDWKWNKAAADGFVFGPLPNDGFCFTIQFPRSTGVDRGVNLGSAEADGSLSFLKFTKDEGKKGIEICAHTCTPNYGEGGRLCTI